MAGVFPRQKVTNAEKDPAWYRDNTDSIINQADEYSLDIADMIELYRAAMGELDLNSYSHVINPFNTSGENSRKFPVRLRNYDIIIPIISLFLGEKANRPFNHRTVLSNPDIDNEKLQKSQKEFLATLSQDFINGLNEQGVDTGIPTQQIPGYGELMSKYQSNSIVDERAIVGEEALEYIKHQLALKDKYLEGMYDWLVVGKVFTYKDVFKNDLIHEIVPPLELRHGVSKTTFIEDAAWARRKSRYGLNDVVDRFHEAFSEGAYNDKGNKIDAIQILEDRYRNGTTFTSSINGESYTSLDTEVDRDIREHREMFHSSGGLIEVYHVVWKGFVKVGVLSYRDELGQPQEMEVADDYKLNKENGDIEIKWEWMSIVHEQYKIDQDIYVYGRELQVQRQELSNTSKVKLPYNGRIGYSERDKINSIVKRVLPYQTEVNIYRWRLNLMIAKNKEKIMTLPLGLLPDGNGWDEDKVFHFVEAMNILVLDETKPNAIAALNALKSIDMSLGKYISEMIQLIKDTKNEAWDAIGMNRQRYGDVNSSDGKGTNEQAIIRSSVISRELNRRYERFEETDIQGLIEYSKVAWIDGKKGSYITSEGTQAFLNIDGATWPDSDIGVFVVDSQEEFDKLSKAKDYAFGYAQKAEVPGSVVLEILDSNNMSKLKRLVAKSEEIQRQHQQEASKAEATNAQALKQQELEKEKVKGDIDIQVQKMKSDTAIQVALIGTSGNEENMEDDSSISRGHDDYIDRARKDISKRDANGLKYADKIGNDRLREAKLQLDRESLQLQKQKASNQK